MLSLLREFFIGSPLSFLPESGLWVSAWDGVHSRRDRPQKSADVRSLKPTFFGRVLCTRREVCVGDTEAPRGLLPGEEG